MNVYDIDFVVAIHVSNIHTEGGKSSYYFNGCNIYKIIFSLEALVGNNA
jgi:hypothetical protein